MTSEDMEDMMSLLICGNYFRLYEQNAQKINGNDSNH